MYYPEKLLSSLYNKVKPASFHIVFGIFFCSMSTTLFSQELPKVTSNQFRPHIIHGALGFAGIILTVTINYERVVTQHFDKFITATYGKVGYGAFGDWGGSG